MGKGTRLAGLLCDTGRVDQDVHRAEFLHDARDDAGDCVGVADVDFVGLHGDAGGVVELGGGFVSEVLLYVEDGDCFDSDF